MGCWWPMHNVTFGTYIHIIIYLLLVKPGGIDFGKIQVEIRKFPLKIVVGYTDTFQMKGLTRYDDVTKPQICVNIHGLHLISDWLWTKVVFHAIQREFETIAYINIFGYTGDIGCDHKWPALSRHIQTGQEYLNDNFKNILHIISTE